MAQLEAEQRSQEAQQKQEVQQQQLAAAKGGWGLRVGGRGLAAAAAAGGGGAREGRGGWLAGAEAAFCLAPNAQQAGRCCLEPSPLTTPPPLPLSPPSCSPRGWRRGAPASPFLLQDPPVHQVHADGVLQQGHVLHLCPRLRGPAAARRAAAAPRAAAGEWWRRRLEWRRWWWGSAGLGDVRQGGGWAPPAVFCGCGATCHLLPPGAGAMPVSAMRHPSALTPLRWLRPARFHVVPCSWRAGGSPWAARQVVA